MSDYLAATEFKKMQVPLSSAPREGEDDPKGSHFSCQRTTTVYVLTTAGGWSAVPKNRLAALRAREPALGKIRKDGSAQGNTEESSLPACDALER